MCGPMIALGIASAAGSLMQGQAGKALNNAKADEAGYQAAQNRADAQAEREFGEVRADKVRKAGGFQQKQAKAAQAKSGVVADAGTALTVQEYIRRSSEEDALNEILTGQYKARKIEQGAATLDREASYDRRAGDAAFTSGIMGAGKSLLGSFTGGPGSGWKVQQ